MTKLEPEVNAEPARSDHIGEKLSVEDPTNRFWSRSVEESLACLKATQRGLSARKPPGG